MSQVNVRYMIEDVPAAVRFYTTLLGFTVEQDASPAFASVARDGVRLLLSGEGSSGKRPLSDGRTQQPGGWNRIHLEVADLAAEVSRLRAAGVPFRTGDIVTGPGGAQIILDDPSGNPVELFQPRAAEGGRPATTHADAVFEIKSWDEKPYEQLAGGGKLTRAVVSKQWRGDIRGDSTWESTMCYRADGSAVFMGFERIVGGVGDKEGSFVFEARGTYESGAARCECRVVPGSGTGGLAGLAGEGRYVATHTDYPNIKFSMDYRFESAR